MMGFIGNIGPWELIFILLIALIVVGPGKLPEVARSLGKATRDFKKATSGIQKDINDVMKYDFEEEKKTAINIKKETPVNEVQAGENPPVKPAEEARDENTGSESAS